MLFFAQFHFVVVCSEAGIHLESVSHPLLSGELLKPGLSAFIRGNQQHLGNWLVRSLFTSSSCSKDVGQHVLGILITEWLPLCGQVVFSSS